MYIYVFLLNPTAVFTVDKDDANDFDQSYEQQREATSSVVHDVQHMETRLHSKQRR